MFEQLKETLGASREVVILSMARFLDALANGILIIVMPLYVAVIASPNFNLPQETMVGVLIAAFGILMAITQPFAGVLSDRLGKRKAFIVIGLALLGVVTFGYIPAKTFTALLVVRGIQGIGFALTLPATLSLMSAYSKQESRGGSMGIFTTSRMLGFGIGPLLGGVMSHYLGFNLTFIIVGVLLFGGVGTVAGFVKERAPEPLSKEESNLRSLFGSLNHEFVLLGLSTVAMASAISMMVALENQFNQRLEETAIGFGLAFSALTISRVFLQIPLGRLADLWGRKVIIISGFILLAPATVVLGYVATTLQLVLVRVVQGIATAGLSSPIFALAGDKVEARTAGTQMSVVTMAFGLGIAMGPLVAGWMAGYLSFQSPFLLGGGLCLLGAAMVGFGVTETVHRQHKKPPEKKSGESPASGQSQEQGDGQAKKHQPKPSDTEKI